MAGRIPNLSNPFDNLPSDRQSYGSVRRSVPHSFIIDDSPDVLPGLPASGRQQFGPKILSLLLLFGLAALVIRAFTLQIVQGASRLDQAENNRIKREIQPAMRGLILDRDKQPLVKNVPNFVLSIVPYDLPHEQEVRERSLSEISVLLGLDASQLNASLNEVDDLSRNPIIVTDHLPYEKALRYLASPVQYGGVTVAPSSNREYSDGQAYAHVLGYVGQVTTDDLKKIPNEYYPIDSIGKTGLELTYESRLRGLHGYRDVERDHLNREKRVISSAEPRPGLTLQTSINSSLQKTLADSLASSILTSRASGGAVVALDPRNGEVLAMVSQPSVDTNDLILGITPEDYSRLLNNPNKPFINRSIAGEYPSGSTIKPYIASAGLQEGIITDKTIYQSTGGIQINRWFFPDWKQGGHGPTNLTKALAESVNTYFYIVGGGYEQNPGLGVERITYYLRRFGFSSKTGVDLPNERAGFLPSKDWKDRTKGEAWYVGDTYHYAIGQGDLLVTPMQIAVALASVANGGTVYQPRLAKAWFDSKGVCLEEVQPEVIRDQVIDSQYLKSVRRGLREAVVSGSAVSLSSFPIPVAGKTGTAEYGSEGKTHAWFTAFAPYDSPEIVLVALIEGGGEGHASALPVVAAGLRDYFNL